MKKLHTALIGVAATAGLLTSAGIAQAGISAGQGSAAVSSAPVQLNGGMVAGHSGRTEAAAKLPSCHAITYRGNAGAIHVQTSSNRTVAWGIYMYNSKLDSGPWTVDVYVGSKRVDHKQQNYAPHGSVNPKQAKKGAEFKITATHYATANKTWYHSVPNGCIIP